LTHSRKLIISKPVAFQADFIMFRFAADRLPVFIVLLFSILDFTVYFLVENIWWLLLYFLLIIIPKGIICAWNHHHQHTPTFFLRPLNRLLEFFLCLTHGGYNKPLGTASCSGTS